jgi:hypothetical protein
MAELPTYGELPVDIDPTAWYGRTFTPPISLDISTIQNAIAAQLESTLSPIGINSYVFPNYDIDTWWKGTSIAFCLVGYRATDFSKPQSTSAMLQERTLEFSIIVIGRTVSWALAGPGSIYALIDAIEASLSGFRPPGCREGYFISERFREQDTNGSTWLYELKYKITTIRPKLLPEFALANLRQITNLIYSAGTGTPTDATIDSGTVQLAANTVVLSIVSSNGVKAQVGIDYIYNTFSGLVTITDSGVLTDGMAITLNTAPVVDQQTIT